MASNRQKFRVENISSDDEYAVRRIYWDDKHIATEIDNLSNRYYETSQIEYVAMYRNQLTTIAGDEMQITLAELQAALEHNAESS